MRCRRAARLVYCSQPVQRTLLDFFRSFADSPSQFALYDDGYRRWKYTYRQIATAAQAFSARLRDESIGKGEKILFWSENRPEWLAAFWGCLLQGVIVVPVDYRASADALRNIQRVVRAQAVLVGEEVKQSALGDGIPVWRLADIGISAQPYPMSTVEVSPDDVAEIVFTSGSTATPKGVIITHRNIVADLAPLEREVQKYGPWVRPLYPLRFLNLLPLSHMFGQALATFFPPMLRGVVVFMHSYASHEVISQIHRRRVSFLVAVPKMLEVLRQYVVRQVPELARVTEDSSHWLIRRWRYRKVHRLFGLKFFGFVVGGAPLDSGLRDSGAVWVLWLYKGMGLPRPRPL